MKAINAYNEILKSMHKTKIKKNMIGIIYESLGDIFNRIAIIENRLKNCKKSIDAYNKAFKIFKEIEDQNALIRINPKLINSSSL